MSIKCMTRIWEQTPKSIKGSKLLLLLAIADFAHDNGHAWPGIAALAGKIRMSERHTLRLLDELESAGVLYIDRRGYVNQYLVTVGLSDEEIDVTLAESFNLTPMEIHIALMGIREPDPQAQKHGDILSPCFDDQHGDKLSNMVTSCQEEGDIFAQHGDKLSEHGDMDVTRTIRTEKKPPEEPSEEPSGANSVRSTGPQHISSKHPAVLIYKATGIARPQAAVRDVIGETVGAEAAALTVWQSVVRWWMTSGGSNGGKKNPRNVEDMLAIWRDAMSYLEPEGGAQQAFEAWREVRKREGWSRAYVPPQAYASSATNGTLPLPGLQPEGPPEAALWEQVKEQARLGMMSATYDTHVRGTHCLGPNGTPDTWVVVCDNVYSVEWLDTRLRALLERAAEQVAGSAVHLQFTSENCTRNSISREIVPGDQGG